MTSFSLEPWRLISGLLVGEPISEVACVCETSYSDLGVLVYYAAASHLRDQVEIRLPLVPEALRLLVGWHKLSESSS